MGTSKKSSAASDVMFFHNHMIAAFNESSDATAALLAASHIDATLEWVLRAFLVTSSATDHLLEVGGPLGTISAKANAAYAMGLLEECALPDFVLLERISSAFSRASKPLSFAKKPVSAWCDQLVLPHLLAESEEDEVREPRLRFRLTVNALNAWAEHALTSIQDGVMPKRQAPPDSDMLDGG